MNKALLILFLSALLMLVLSCGTDPSDNPVNIRLETDSNQPYVYVRPPEEPEGDVRVVTVDWIEHSGRVTSYVRRFEYGNITITRDVSGISYYSYWWLRNRIRSYRETRTFEPFGEETVIVIEYCLYSNGVLNNYRAIIDGSVYYFSEEFSPDTLDYSSPN